MISRFLILKTETYHSQAILHDHKMDFFFLIILMHLLKSGSCLRKRAISTRIANKIPSMFLIQCKAQQAVRKVNGMWGKRKQDWSWFYSNTHSARRGDTYCRRSSSHPQMRIVYFISGRKGKKVGNTGRQTELMSFSLLISIVSRGTFGVSVK